MLHRATYFWIKSQVEKEKEKGVDPSKFAHSMVVSTMAPTNLGSLRKADGEEGLKDAVAANGKH